MIVVRLGTRHAGEALRALSFPIRARQALALSGGPGFVAIRVGESARLTGKDTTEDGHEKCATQASRSFQTRNWFSTHREPPCEDVLHIVGSVTGFGHSTSMTPGQRR